ncbi:MAG: enoyl-CoA hydratase/isomerase family protein [Deltaproteobacteria bacterium]|nr:enoyl-CoA hydratase/isomerase family protein [Deltaproteobacteria bacterium]
MESDVLLTAREGDVVTLTLNRPEKRNAMTVPMLTALRSAFHELAAAENVRAVVLTGSGKAFCSGLDLKEMGLARRPDGSVEYSDIEDALHALEHCPLPTIAMIQGEAIAGGLELALHCDLRIAGASARMGMPLARIGLVVPYPLTQKLLDTVGTAMTKELLFTGALLDAESARRAGLVGRVVPDAELAAATRTLAAEIAANAPLSIRAMKAAINEANAFRSLTPSPELAAQAAAARKSEDLQEGLRSVFERRRPAFRGR